jgi:hypothetical protein
MAAISGKGYFKTFLWLVSIKEKLKEFKPSGVTNEQIDQLISFY